MKLSILLAGSILTSAIVGNVYAQTCGAQPSWRSAIVLLSRLYLYRQHFRLCQHPDEVPL